MALTGGLGKRYLQHADNKRLRLFRNPSSRPKNLRNIRAFAFFVVQSGTAKYGAHSVPPPSLGETAALDCLLVLMKPDVIAASLATNVTLVREVFHCRLADRLNAVLLGNLHGCKCVHGEFMDNGGDKFAIRSGRFLTRTICCRTDYHRESPCLHCAIRLPEAQPVARLCHGRQLQPVNFGSTSFCLRRIPC